MKSCKKVVHQLNFKKKEKTGDRGVISTTPYNAFSVFIPIYFTFRNVRNATLTESLISRANIYILE